MKNSAIEWCDHTFNAWEGCTKVSPGCANCYAATRNARWNHGTAINWGQGAPRRRTSQANWKLPVKWSREDERKRVSALHSWPAGKPMPWTRPRVFCSSLADWLDDEVPIEWLADLLDLIRLTPNLDWLLLSKRPQNWMDRIGKAARCIRERGGDMSMLCAWGHGNAPDNCWIGTTVENQAMADKRIPLLLSIPTKVRFLSCEPLLCPVNLNVPVMQGTTFIVGDEGGHEYVGSKRQMLDWVICGGESGPGARQFHCAWARSLLVQCRAQGIPFFMKQLGGTRKPFAPIPADLMIREFPKGGAA